MENLENLEFCALLFQVWKSLQFAQKHEQLGILEAEPGIFII